MYFHCGSTENCRKAGSTENCRKAIKSNAARFHLLLPLILPVYLCRGECPLPPQETWKPSPRTMKLWAENSRTWETRWCFLLTKESWYFEKEYMEDEMTA